MATINDAVREMYLTQTGRAADPGGLEYFANRFGSSIEPEELAIFRQMAADEVAGQEARQAAAAAQQAAVVNQLTAQLTAAGMSPADFFASGGQLPATASTTAGTEMMTQSELRKAMQESALPFTDTTAGTGATGTAAAAEAARVLAAQQAAAAAQQQAAQQAAAAEAARVLAAQQAAATTAGSTGMNITQAYQQVLGRTPSQQEIDYWTSQFGPDVDATELSTFSVAAQPERAAVPTTNNAIRQMYLSVLGREPDASGLKYFSDRFGTDVDTGELDIFKGMSTQEINANAARNAAVTAGTGTTTGTAATGTTTSLTGTGTPGATTRTGATTGTVQPITRPPPIRQVTSSQLAPASVTNTAITGTPYTNIYTPATVQQNAPTLAQINAASQSANPYQSLMALTPQRTLSPAYAGMLGQTTANTNLGGYDTSLYSKPLTGLLAPSTVAGGGGADGVNNSGDQRGPGTDNTGDGQTFYGGLANLAGEANRAGFTGLGGFLASGLPVGAAYKGGTLTAADIAALTGKVDLGSSVSLGNQGYGGGSDAPGANADGYGGGDAGFGGGSQAFAKGGKVNMAPQMNNPPGPDDGYAALDNGEYVIRKKAVKKYGSNIFEQINAGKIPAQRLKSLLE